MITEVPPNIERNKKKQQPQQLWKQNEVKYEYSELDDGMDDDDT